jgi:DNA polymerase-3 subunit epsilon
LAVRGIDAVAPDTLLIVRARELLASGSLDSVSLMERVCALPSAPPRVADRLAEALFGRHTDFVRDADGRWSLVPDRNGVRAVLIPVESVDAPLRTVRERRQAATGARESDDVALRDVRFAVVDVETTGTSPAQRDRVTEIAIVQVAGGEVTECYETLVNPERAIPPAIVALTRITEEMVRSAPRFPSVASDVVGRLRERVFVAHNAPFDWRFVSHEVQRAAGVALTGEQLCTVRLARLLLPQLPRRSLDAVTHYFGIDIGARHRAAGDALATAHVLLRLLRLAEDRGATTWRELTALMQRGGARAKRRRSAMPRGVDLDPTL